MNYDPFISIKPGRNLFSDAYRNLFNGKEADNEWNGTTGG